MKRYNDRAFESVDDVKRHADTAWTPCQNGRRWDGKNWVDIFAKHSVEFTKENMDEWCKDAGDNDHLFTKEKQNEVGIRFYSVYGNQMDVSTYQNLWKNPWNTVIQAIPINPASETDIYGQYFEYDFSCNKLVINFKVEESYGTLENSQYEVHIYELDDSGNEIEGSEQIYVKTGALSEITAYDGSTYDYSTVITGLKICNKRARVIVTKTDGALMLYGIKSYNS